MHVERRRQNFSQLGMRQRGWGRMPIENTTNSSILSLLQNLRLKTKQIPENCPNKRLSSTRGDALGVADEKIRVFCFLRIEANIKNAQILQEHLYSPMANKQGRRKQGANLADMCAKLRRNFGQFRRNFADRVCADPVYSP